ncbi:MAG TPA: RecX family transcriptional regulator [Solirubrobacteraceae bacterium]|nr:RecX family transcriptional regulator [Solirubrobacteraceae bacterium]
MPARGQRPRTEAEQRAQALAWALVHVNRRERTTAEMRAHLARKGVSEATANDVVEELVAEGLVDDMRFAEMFVADKRTLERWGSERIRRGLAERGVDRELAERALAAAGDAGTTSDGEAATELDRALELLRSRFPNPPRERRDRDRALGMLLRKGYESELALDALAAHARAGTDL